MIRLVKATINRYKCIEKEQSFNVEDNITVLVGMNESGKTSILEALSKANYFEDDDAFKFNATHDYPRNQKKQMDKSGVIPEAIKLQYEIDDKLKAAIEKDVGIVIQSTQFSFIRKYDNSILWTVSFVDKNAFVKAKAKTLGIKNKELIKALTKVSNALSFDAFVKGQSAETDAEILKQIKTLRKYFENKHNWDNCIDEYITMTYLAPNLPKFIYYDDYYMLPGRVSLNDIASNSNATSSDKTAKALLELADIDVNKVIRSTNYEDFIAELEATQATITDELFKYWTTNKNLKILFNIDKVEQTDNRNNRRIVDHVLDIRVQNQRNGVSLPLSNRSKGFNWFFSFLVWFMKIQESRNDTYILLLDEPGLNLHAKAQNDLLRFLCDLSTDYQIIYTTHSPFMIETEHLNQVRTVLEKDDGTHISESVQEKDPNTLFPLQAALGYDLAQNLFVAKKNLLVEGIADLTYLTIISNMLSESNRVCLKDDVVIVPTGGVDKIATFVSLLRGNELSMVCLLDTFTDKSAQARLNNLTAQNIIKDKKIVFYHDILNRKFADVEDMFSLDDYLCLYNGAFGKNICRTDIDDKTPILMQLKKLNSGKDFNHYAPANYLAKNVASISLSDETMEHFENLFQMINKLF
ncbi:MAG: AAA family ATPase [Firmicutes bacterium]|nr:AAA family ATPase [Bacillota bacterium]